MTSTRPAQALLPVQLGQTGPSVLGFDQAMLHVDRLVQRDSLYKDLNEILPISSTLSSVTVSGVREVDYPSCRGDGLGGELSITRTTPIPPELVDKFVHMERNCLMGIFPEIQRVWLTIDQEIFVWNFADGSDLAYYDGVGETIVCVGFARPRPGIFTGRDVHYLLCLATPVELVVLGLSLQPQQPMLPDGMDSGTELHLLPTPLYRLSTDNQSITCIEATDSGRIFLGARSGCILEFEYHAQAGWFTRQCKLVNHSVSAFSFLLPNILTLGQDDAVCQIAVDSTRNCVYLRTERSQISAYQLTEGGGTRRLACLSESQVVTAAASAARMVDRSQFRGMVHLAPLSSPAVHLLGVTQAGVRLYFGPGLRLLHVRVPPSSPGVVAPGGEIRLAAESRGTVLLLSSPGPTSPVAGATAGGGAAGPEAGPGDMTCDSLVCLSPDAFPWSSNLAETRQLSWPIGRAWSLLPVGAASTASVDYKDAALAGRAPPPVCLTQHVDPPRRFLLVSAQGLSHLELHTPLQRLADLLLQHGPQSPEVRHWCHHFGPEEALFCLLMLHSRADQSEVAERARTALFVQNGELMRSVPVAPPSGDPGGEVTPSNFMPLHMGIALYAARILRPLWDAPIASEFVPPGKTSSQQSETYLASRLDAEELSWFIGHLRHLHAFIADHLSQLRPRPILRLGPDVAGKGGPAAGDSAGDDWLPEMRLMLKSVIEILGLWRLLAEHQFFLLARRLSSEQADQLKRTPFKNLMAGASSRPLLLSLIAALLEHYLSDNASVDAISAKLQETCPSLFASEDAFCAKANELVQFATAQLPGPPGESNNSNVALQAVTESERQSALTEAVSLYKRAGPGIELTSILPRLRAAGHYSGIVELCLWAAAARDPENRALIFVREGRPPNNEIETRAVQGRYEAYSQMIDLFDWLREKSCVSVTGTTTGSGSGQSPDAKRQPSSPIPRYPGHIPSRERAKTGENAAQMAAAANARSSLQTLLRQVFKGEEDDVLVHYELLSWMLSCTIDGPAAGLPEMDVLESGSPHLESYLKNCLRRDVDNVRLRELLWRHCERQGKLLEAAKVLEHLAVSYNESVPLASRLEYLSRAVVCVKAAGASYGAGDYLRELEDKLETASLQREVSLELRERHRLLTDDVSDSLRQLEAQLYNLTQLYSMYADRYRLPVSKLLLLRSAGHRDPCLVETLWEELLEDEFGRYMDLPIQARQTSLAQSISTLARRFVDSDAFFPRDHVVTLLERYACEKGLSDKWTVDLMVELSFPWFSLLTIYDMVLRRKEPFWQSPRGKCHIMGALVHLLTCFVGALDKQPARTRQMQASRALDLVTSYLVDLQSSHDAESTQLVLRMKSIKADLMRYLKC